MALEQLWWLLRMAGHALADGGEGETPLVPVPISAACAEAAAQGRTDPVQSLTSALLGVLSLELDPGARPVLSPRCVRDSGLRLHPKP